MRSCLRIVLACCIGIAAESAAAAEVFKCSGAGGQIAFQDQPCALDQRGERVAPIAAPAFVPSPDYGVGTTADRRGGMRGRRVGYRADTGGADARGHVERSYECRADNGDVFYKHSTCPSSIRVGGSGRRGERATVVHVSSIAISRGDACERMRHAVGRSGRARDDDVSTYERNEGRDPCR